MSNDSLEERITKIESNQSFSDSLLKEQRDDIKEIKNAVNEIKTSMAVFQSQHPPIEQRVRFLEDKANQAFGGWKMIVIFCSLGAFLLKEVVSWLNGK